MVIQNDDEILWPDYRRPFDNSFEFSTSEYGKRNRRLDACFKSAGWQLQQFLDDPIRVAAYNSHVDQIIAKYQSDDANENETLYYSSLKLNPANILLFQNLDFTCQQFPTPHLAHIEGEGSDRRHIKFDPKHISNLSDDEIVKSILHEQLHGLVKLQPGAYLHQTDFPSFLARKKMHYAQELAADAFSDFVMPSLPYATLVKKLMLHQMGELNVDTDFTQRAFGQDLDEFIENYLSIGGIEINKQLNWKEIQKNGNYLSDDELEDRRAILKSQLKHSYFNLTPEEKKQQEVVHGQLSELSRQNSDPVRVFDLREYFNEYRSMTHPSIKGRHDNSIQASYSILSTIDHKEDLLVSESNIIDTNSYTNPVVNRFKDNILSLAAGLMLSVATISEPASLQNGSLDKNLFSKMNNVRT